MIRPLLYTYRRCPYAMRARMALIMAGMEFDAYEISLREKPAEMLAVSPKGTVPVLVLPTGEVLEQSLHIMRWAFEQHDPTQWWSRAQSPENLALVSLNDGMFKQLLDRYKYPERFNLTERNTPRDQAVSGFIQQLEQRFHHALYLGGQQPCAADIALFPFVRQYRAVDEQWFDAQALPETQRWLQEWLQSELFNRCMKKLPSATRVGF